MKLEITLNLGNYENIKFETNEYKTLINCYAEMDGFLGDWINYTDNAKKLLKQILKITGPKTSSQNKSTLTPAETKSLRKLEQEWEDDEDNSLKPSNRNDCLKEGEAVFMDLTEVTIVAQTEKALLASKKGYQKWVAFSLITNIDIDAKTSYLGRYFEKLNIKTDKEKWFHDKKSWVEFQVRS